MEYSYSRIFKFFWQFVGQYKWKFFLGSIFVFIASVVGLYQGYAFSQIVDILSRGTDSESFRAILIILATWLLTTTSRQLFGFFSKYINFNVAEKAAIDAEIYSMKHMSLLDMSWHERENTGNKLKKIDRGARGINDITRLWTNDVISMVVTFFGALIILMQFDFKLGVFIFLYQLMYYFIASFSRKRAIKAHHLTNIKGEEVNGLWFEIASNTRSVKVLGMSAKLFDYARDLTSELAKRIDKRIFWFQAGGYSQKLWEGLIKVVLVGYVIWEIGNGKYEVGFLVLFYSYFNVLTDAAMKFTDAAQEIASAKANIGRLTELLDEKVNIDKEKGKVKFPKSWDKIEVKNLTFKYGENVVLNNINFEIKKGEKIGIVGLSGAGKSTLFKLLLKEHESYEGEILFGGTTLRKISKASYVNHIAAVLQETEVFNMSLRQNIILANSAEENNSELFERSLSIAHVNDFLSKLPQRAETTIGEKGVKLSGGEKQRLGIARAVFKEPEVLFLDEATSHLDVESEQKIQDSLHKFFNDVTAVVIAHRLSTIKEMDRIIVIEGGEIIESGTFDELNAQSGRFREFWDKQRV